MPISGIVCIVLGLVLLFEIIMFVKIYKSSIRKHSYKKVGIELYGCKYCGVVKKESIKAYLRTQFKEQATCPNGKKAFIETLLLFNSYDCLD